MAPLSPTGKVSKHTKETQSLGYTVTTISHLPKKPPFPLSPSPPLACCRPSKARLPPLKSMDIVPQVDEAPELAGN